MSGYKVVWSGRDELLPPRPERMDQRFAAMPSYDLDEGEVVKKEVKRKYNRSGLHAGKFSRTNPLIPQFRPQKESK